MNGDHYAGGGHHRKADPKHVQAIKEGGIKAQKIAKETTAKHEEEEVPKAEEQLLQELTNIENSHLKSATK